jgi:hypothetical protein
MVLLDYCIVLNLFIWVELVAFILVPACYGSGSRDLISLIAAPVLQGLRPRTPLLLLSLIFFVTIECCFGSDPIAKHCRDTAIILALSVCCCVSRVLKAKGTAFFSFLRQKVSVTVRHMYAATAVSAKGQLQGQF